MIEKLRGLRLTKAAELVWRGWRRRSPITLPRRVSGARAHTDVFDNRFLAPERAAKTRLEVGRPLTSLISVADFYCARNAVLLASLLPRGDEQPDSASPSQSRPLSQQLLRPAVLISSIRSRSASGHIHATVLGLPVAG
jgi:hypothetical protein